MRFRLLGHATIIILGLAGGLRGWSMNVWAFSSQPAPSTAVDESRLPPVVPHVSGSILSNPMAWQRGTESSNALLVYSREEIAAISRLPQPNPPAAATAQRDIAQQASASPTPRPALAPTPTPPPAKAVVQAMPGATAVVPAPQPASSDVVTLATKLLGAPYVWGGTTPQGFDCTGFVRYVFGQRGMELPRTLSEQFALGKTVERQALRPGDLVFFQNTFERGLSHVGIYVDNGQFISAASELRGVAVDSLDAPFWAERYLGARRP